MILLAAFLSFKTTNAEIRKKNHFTWGAIQEVAVLFIGIFITMQPALMILKSAGAELGLTHPSQMFWVTGALSSFLDNTPTYLVFLTTAGSMGFASGLTTALGVVPAKMLTAISCGAVFMGAMTISVMHLISWLSQYQMKMVLRCQASLGILCGHCVALYQYSLLTHYYSLYN